MPRVDTTRFTCTRCAGWQELQRDPGGRNPEMPVDWVQLIIDQRIAGPGQDTIIDLCPDCRTMFRRFIQGQDIPIPSRGRKYDQPVMAE